ncbi:MAG: cellulase family glycosylhydrolase [Bacillota bacterium]
MQSQARLLMTHLLLITLACGTLAHAAEFLRTRGQDMVDESGRKVLLQGVGLGNWMLPEGYMWKFGNQGDRPRKIEAIVADLIGPQNADRFWLEFRKRYITEADIQRIAKLGFNSVRPALNARRFLTEGGNPVYVAEGFELLDNLVGWCKKYNVYVIIDMHGAPGGQTGQNIDDSPRDLPELFMDEKYQQRLLNLWIKIADRYKDEPTVAAYDLLNEPLPQRTGAAAKYKAQLEPLYKRLTQAIRQIDKRHMITVEGADWANDWSVFSEPFDNNLVYQFHYYCWDRPDTLKGIEQYLTHRKRLNAPVWVGETGEKSNNIYWATTQYFEANNIGWSFWPWKKMNTTNTPYSIKKPAGWDEITAYSRGQGKPSQETAQKVFDELLENIKIENCVAFPDVVNAMFRRVPGRVEAENYGHEGLNKSYFVKDLTSKAKSYRKSEPVPVEQNASASSQSRAGQSIRLLADEWTAYTVNSQATRDYKATVRVKADPAPAVFTVSINGQSTDMTITGNDWIEVNLNAIRLSAGANRLQLTTKTGVLWFDWLSFE